ncbi:MAG: adenosylmethionine--8-amino-7-oxononanoate transaminase [Chloroflexi bacterium]|nr:adenosylmethionine--8-amino-7-oxononanoate transaminase [Chloroflexota bacterium]
MTEDRKAQLERDDKAYVWHPFTQMKDWVENDQIIIEEGQGNYLKDIYGREYLDGASSLWVTVHGHRRREIDEAIVRQLKKISHSTLLGLSNVPAIELARELVQITPAGLNKVFYSDSGSTAVEIALKIAFQFWQQSGRPAKTGFVSFKNAYHGDTIGSVSVGGIDLFHSVYRPLLFSPLHSESAYCYRCGLGLAYPECHLACLNQLERLMAEHHAELAALIVEPMVQGAAGMLVSPPGYLRRIRDLCTQHEVLMIADEVAVGFGRTGKMFACEHEDVRPDLMAVAKGITGGYLPLAATLATDRVYEAFLGEYEEYKTFFHGHTYTGNPVACAAAIANLEVFRTDRVLENLQTKIARLAEALRRFQDLLHVGDVRQCGFMVGIELVASRDTKEPYPVQERIGHRVILEARKMGLIIRPLGDVVVLMPPLSTTIDEMERMVDISYRATEIVTG